MCAKEREREIAVFSTTGVSLFSLFALLLRASWGKSLKRVERKKKKTALVSPPRREHGSNRNELEKKREEERVARGMRARVYLLLLVCYLY